MIHDILLGRGKIMSISAFALIFLTIYVGIAQLDALSVKIGLFSPVFGGAVTGLVMGCLLYTSCAINECCD